MDNIAISTVGLVVCILFRKVTYILLWYVTGRLDFLPHIKCYFIFFLEVLVLLRNYEVQLNYKIIFSLSTLQLYTFSNNKLSIIYNLLSGIYLLFGLVYFVSNFYCLLFYCCFDSDILIRFLKFDFYSKFILRKRIPFKLTPS